MEPQPTARAVATPVRAAVLERAVSADAQPRSQQLWDEAFREDSTTNGGGAGKEPEPSAEVAESVEPETARPNEPQEPMEPEQPAAAAQPVASDDELTMDVDCATCLHIMSYKPYIYLYIYLPYIYICHMYICIYIYM